MSLFYTKNGVPLVVRGDGVYNDGGHNFGYLRGDKVYGLDGRYRGTVVGDRLVYRSMQSATISGARAATAGIGGSARAHRAGPPSGLLASATPRGGQISGSPDVSVSLSALLDRISPPFRGREDHGLGVMAR